MSVKSKPFKIVYKVYEVFCIYRDVFFEEDVEKEPENLMAECSKCAPSSPERKEALGMRLQNVGNDVIVNAK